MRYTRDELIADLSEDSGYGDGDYDRIDVLIDSDTIELGRRYRAALVYLRGESG